MFYGGLWSSNFYPAIRGIGHEIIESQVDLEPTSRFMFVPKCFTPEELETRARTTEEILQEVHDALRKGTVDLFLSYFYNSHFDPEGLDVLRHLGIPTVNYYCNSTHQFELVEEIAKKVDYSWHTEHDAGVFYKGVGANPIWVQMGADPNIYFPVNGIERKKKSVFIGQRYADRGLHVAALIENNISIDVYGSGWKSNLESSDAQINSSYTYLGRVHTPPGKWASYRDIILSTLNEKGCLSGIKRLIRHANFWRKNRSILDIISPHAVGRANDISEVLASYEICLNFSNVWADSSPGSELVPHVRLRDFEAPMCKTCYLTGHTEEIGEFYNVGKEIDTYRSIDELLDKTQFYLCHIDSAEKMRQAGYSRAIRDHTWSNRFIELFTKLDLS